MARVVSYILVQIAPGNANSVAKAIGKVPGVKMAHAVTGPFDVIAFVDVANLEELSDLVLSRVQRVKGVEKTQTAVVVTPVQSPPRIVPGGAGRSRSGNRRKNR